MLEECQRLLGFQQPPPKKVPGILVSLFRKETLKLEQSIKDSY